MPKPNLRAVNKEAHRATAEAFRKHKGRALAAWAHTPRRSVSYMDVTYECGCTVRGDEVDHVCNKHLKRVKKIVRTTEYV